MAQSKRELTPEIVKAALYGSAGAKIPPPQINLTSTPQPLPVSAPAASTPQSSVVTPTLSQNLGFGGPQVNPSVNQHLSQESKLMKPPLPTSTSTSQPTQGVATQGFSRGGPVAGPRPPSSSSSSDWAGGSTVGTPTVTSSQVQNQGTTQLGLDGFGLGILGSTTGLPPRPQVTSGVKPSGPPAKDAKDVNISGNGFASDSSFGGDVFSATASQPKQDASMHAFSARSLPVSPALVPNSAASQPSVRPTVLDSIQSIPTSQTSGIHIQPATKPNMEVSAQTITSIPGVSLTADNSATGQSQVPWPKMTQTSVQKYMKVFVEVDTDRDGKITGEQARNLFLSWRLPRGRKFILL